MALGRVDLVEQLAGWRCEFFAGDAVEDLSPGLAEKAEVHRFRDRSVEIVVEESRSGTVSLRAASLAALIMMTGVGHPSSWSHARTSIPDCTPSERWGVMQLNFLVRSRRSATLTDTAPPMGVEI